jgi:hypothetical protein
MSETRAEDIVWWGGSPGGVSRPLDVDYTLQRRHRVAFLRPGTRFVSGVLWLAWGGEVAFLDIM